MTETDKIEFTEEAIEKYLSNCIEYWRMRGYAGSDECSEYYIDAYQSVYSSIFGKCKK